MTEIRISIYNSDMTAYNEIIDLFAVLVNHTPAPGGHWTSWIDLKLEVQKWLVTHCAKQFAMYLVVEWHEGDHRNRDRAAGPAFDLRELVIRFDDPRDAVLFKLTWL